jgi:hypothetical protein
MEGGGRAQVHGRKSHAGGQKVYTLFSVPAHLRHYYLYYLLMTTRKES